MVASLLPAHVAFRAGRRAFVQTNRVDNLMPSYDFEVRQGDRVLHLRKSIPVDEPRVLWARIHELARRFDAPGRRIFVRDERGGITVAIGMRAAQRLALMAA